MLFLEVCSLCVVNYFGVFVVIVDVGIDLDYFRVVGVVGVG